MTKAQIQYIRSLHDKRARTEAGVFIAEGEKLVCDLIDSDLEVVSVFCCDDSLADAIKDKIAKQSVNRGRAVSRDLNMERISQSEMERISALKTHSQVLIIVRIPIYNKAVDTRRSLVIALDGVQDPGNMGTIIRVADWFGISDIVCSADCADCYNPKVVQATMGAIARVRVQYMDLCEFLDRADAPIYGTFLEGDNIYKGALTPHGVIVMGSEGRGISSQIESIVTHKLFIPPFPADKQANSESLNVAVATAIICSEFRRR